MMAASLFGRTTFLSGSCPMVQYVRNRSKINIQKPRPKHHTRRVLEEISKPIIFPEIFHPAATCGRRPQLKVEVNLYEDFLVRRCKELFERNNMIMVCQANAMSKFEQSRINLSFQDLGLQLVNFGTKIFLQAIANTKYENMSRLFINSNLYIIGSDDKVKEMVSALKKQPKLHLLGGLLNDQILTRAGCIKIAELPNIEILRGQLVGTLNTAAGGRTLQHLNFHQQKLSQNFDQHVRQKTETLDS